MPRRLQFGYKMECHCGAYCEGEAGKYAVDDIPDKFKKFFEEHKDCEPKKKKKQKKKTKGG